MQKLGADPFALESGSSELYGVLGQRSHLISPYSSSFATSKTRSDTTKRNGPAGSSSDASTSSSSGVAMSAGSSNNHQRTKLESSDQSSSDGQFLSTSVTLEYNKPFKIFDMSKFKKILERESLRPCPNRRRLQSQCISVISFVVSDKKMLNLPSWIMIINIVAIDLLKSEIGLIDSQDLFGQPAAPPPLPPSMRHVFATGSERSQLQLGAAAAAIGSKKVFPGAAATGAYNVNHHDHFNMSRGDTSTVNELALELQRRRDKQSIKSSKIEHLQQSSGCSSGFNSQCSSQEDSLAQSNTTDSSQSTDSSTSDNSNGHCSEHEHKPQDATGYNNAGKGLSKQDLEIRAELANAAVAAAKTPRGKRPPKMPHRFGSPAGKMSEPIAIPAPPTSAGADATGTANLILVSPTGLSPPLPKRKNAVAKDPSWIDDGSCQHGEPSSTQQSRIGEEEVTNLLHRPAGIPAHAQLAPPATQRHILKYLMSSSSSSAIKRDTGKCPQPRIPAPPMRYQRPLPILPGQNERYGRPMHSCQEENLYYCGMQARVLASNRQRAPRAVPPILQPLTTNIHQRAAMHKSAINAMMSDHNLQTGITPIDYNSLLQSNNLLRQQHSLTNLKDPNFYLRFYGSGQDLNKQRKAAIAAAGSKPLMMRLFSNKSDAKPQETYEKTGANIKSENKALFLSADNLHQASFAQDGRKSSPTSILGQMGLKLKGSKPKKQSNNYMI